MAKRKAIAIVGAASLLGRELQELIQARKLPVAVHLFSGEPEAANGNLAVADGEPVYYEPLTGDKLAEAAVILLAGSAESSKRAMAIRPRRAAIVDLTGALEDASADARLRAPYSEAKKVSGPIQIVCHPAAIALDLLLARLSEAAALRSAVVTVFEPASERGQEGIQELQKQTAALLSFQKPPKAIFDTQAAYNMLPAYGDDAPVKLAAVEERIERHLASLIARRGSGTMPSIRVVHAPVFHAYSFGIWVEFSAPGVELAAIASALSADRRIDYRAADVEPPTNSGAAQQSELIVGAVRRDRNNPKAWWMWMACDNLRVAAENAADVLQEIVG